jgi:hypothetical protein
MNENEVAEACSTHERKKEKTNVNLRLENLKGRDTLKAYMTGQ